MAESKKSVMVGMSGGVDSTVAAYLLQQQGYDVVGVTFKLWTDSQDNPEHGLTKAILEAKDICLDLGIPHYVFDYTDKFIEHVVDPFAAEYEQGRTPNPCINCNREIKFTDFLRRAKGMGFDYIATGHYAQSVFDEEQDTFLLKQGTSPEKDQSYFLYSITEEQLPYILFPLGTMDKPDVRQIAEENDLSVAQKADSQDICFIPNGNYINFLDNYLPTPGKAGNFVDGQGNILGEHKGIRNYTIGQRKGLGVAFGKPMYVKELRPETNEVVVGDHEDLFSSVVCFDTANWLRDVDFTSPLVTTAKIRYGGIPSTVTVTREEIGYKAVFEEPQRAVTPGQSIVFYRNNAVIGGGVITK